jgi:Ribosomal protein L7/L12 C-terminal domain
MALHTHHGFAIQATLTLLERSMDTTFWLLLFLCIILIGQHLSPKASSSNNSRLERKVDLILKHLGIDPNQGVDEKIMELVKAGQKIQAIKLYREKTGVGLKEAKDYVEGL